MISVHSTAPEFTLSCLGENGPELVALRDLRASGPVLLLFVPMAFTGVCTEEMCEISRGIGDYTALHAKVVGISGDNPFAQKAWAEKEGISVPLLSDYEHEVAKAYGIAYESFLPQKNLPMGGVPQRSAFLVDQNGVVQYAETSQNPAQLPNFDAIKAKLAQLA